MKTIFRILVLLTISVTTFSAPYHGETETFRQPDGSEVLVKLFGDEYYLRAESLDGYTLIRDEKTGWIYYAALSADSSALLSTGTIYRGDVKTSMKREDNSEEIMKHLDISTSSRLILSEKNRQQFNLQGFDNNLREQAVAENAPAPVLSGKVKGLTIIIDFSDAPGTLPLTEYDNLWNSMTYTNYSNNGSVKKYYYDISGGVLEYENVVFGIFRAPKTFAEYETMAYAAGAQEILGLALNWIKSKGFDFSTLTTDANKNIKAINIMYTGKPKEWAKGMWHHQGSYNRFTANGVRSSKYNCSGANAPLSIATSCHENGHMICGWPDTYKYDETTGVDGIGAFDLMCSMGASTNPVPPNPYFLAKMGWATVTSVNGFNGVKSDISNDNAVYKYSNPANEKEYYLFQSITKTARGKSYPDQGLTIWHIDEAGNNQTTRHQVYLMHANNNISAHQNACWKSTYKTEFNDAATPSAKWYDGSNSGLKCSEVSPFGATMTYKFGSGTVTGLNEEFLLKTHNIYPNPSSGGIFHLNAACIWEAYSLQGILIESGNGDYVNLSQQPKGIYLLHTGHTVKTLIVQ